MAPNVHGHLQETRRFIEETISCYVQCTYVWATLTEMIL